MKTDIIVGKVIREIKTVVPKSKDLFLTITNIEFEDGSILSLSPRNFDGVFDTKLVLLQNGNITELNPR